MIAHLDEVRGLMKELSPGLDVTDPISGDIVAYGADCELSINITRKFFCIFTGSNF